MTRALWMLVFASIALSIAACERKPLIQPWEIFNADFKGCEGG